MARCSHNAVNYTSLGLGENIVLWKKCISPTSPLADRSLAVAVIVVVAAVIVAVVVVVVAVVVVVVVY